MDALLATLFIVWALGGAVVLFWLSDMSGTYDGRPLLQLGVPVVFAWLWPLISLYIIRVVATDKLEDKMARQASLSELIEISISGVTHQDLNSMIKHNYGFRGVVLMPGDLRALELEGLVHQDPPGVWRPANPEEELHQ